MSFVCLPTSVRAIVTDRCVNLRALFLVGTNTLKKIKNKICSKKIVLLCFAMKLAYKNEILWPACKFYEKNVTLIREN